MALLNKIWTKCTRNLGPVILDFLIKLKYYINLKNFEELYQGIILPVVHGGRTDRPLLEYLWL